jgi:hypothetical protein
MKKIIFIYFLLAKSFTLYLEAQQPGAIALDVQVGQVSGIVQDSKSTFAEPSLDWRFPQCVNYTIKYYFKTQNIFIPVIKTSFSTFLQNTDKEISDRFKNSELYLLSIEPGISCRKNLPKNNRFGFQFGLSTGLTYLSLNNNLEKYMDETYWATHQKKNPFYYIIDKDNKFVWVENYDLIKSIKQILPTFEVDLEAHCFVNETVKIFIRAGYRSLWMMPGNHYPDKYWGISSVGAGVALDFTRNKWYFL